MKTQSEHFGDRQAPLQPKSFKGASSASSPNSVHFASDDDGDRASSSQSYGESHLSSKLMGVIQ